MVMISKKDSGVLFAILLGLFFNSMAFAQDPHLEYSQGKVWVKDLDKEILYTFCRYYNSNEVWKEVFPVFTSGASQTSPMDGTYEVYADAVSFTPSYPFANLVTYNCIFHWDQLVGNRNEVYLPPANEEQLTLSFTIDRVFSNFPQPKVTAVYPSAAMLPENLLKFHVAFNSPMTSGDAYKRIRLLDSSGKLVDKPFLVVDQEFWDDSLKTLTILLDPGRLKRGLRPNEEMGTALRDGESYKLVIDNGWKNVDGKVTEETFVKEFACTGADRSIPKLSEWSVGVPNSPAVPLVLQLNERFNRLLLADGIRITSSKGEVVAGKIHVLGDESVVAFEPTDKWKEGTYYIQVNPLLEDLAGNNFNRTFDKDLRVPETDDSPVTSIRFIVKFSSQ
jgi:hypothetical protein